MILFALVVAAATLLLGLVAAMLLRRVRTLRLQLAGLGLLAVVLPLAAVSVSGAVMFSSGHDVVLLFVAASASTASSIAWRDASGVRRSWLAHATSSRRASKSRSRSAAIALKDEASAASSAGPSS
jgi:ABC-type sugar transport system permease subunit